MPKKKLTKLQVRKTIANMSMNLKKLFDDKFTYLGEGSNVPLTLPYMVELNTKLGNAFKRVRK